MTAATMPSSVYRFLSFMALLSAGAAIDCYKCVSINKGDELCEDPFMQDITTAGRIHKNCQYGYFGGTHCYKLKGIKEDGTEILVRDCSNADWGKNCGDIQYQISEDKEERIQGCLTTCNFDGCNTSSITRHCSPLLALMVAVVLVLTTPRLPF